MKAEDRNSFVGMTADMHTHDYIQKGQIKKCEYCAKEYEARNSNQQFCEHECYIKNRFWKKEEANQTINALLGGEKVVIPKWLKAMGCN